MTTQTNHLLEAALKLSVEEREELTDRLMASLCVDPNPDVETAWKEEVGRRVKEIKDGTAVMIPWNVAPASKSVENHMHRTLEAHMEAVYEATAAYQHYEERSVRVADRFFKALETAIERIEATPEAWPEYDEDTRFHGLRKFPYLVIYCLTPTKIQIVATAHAHQEPGYWRERLDDFS